MSEYMPEKNEKIYLGIHVRQATCQNKKFQTISKTTCQLLSANMSEYMLEYMSENQSEYLSEYKHVNMKMNK